MMSHEFRTPLSTTLMFIEMIIPLVQELAVIELVEMMKSQLCLLLSLVNDIVDLKLIKENQFKKNENIINPTKILTFVREMFIHQAKGKKLQLSLKTVHADTLNNPSCIRSYSKLASVALP